MVHRGVLSRCGTELGRPCYLNGRTPHFSSGETTDLANSSQVSVENYRELAEFRGTDAIAPWRLKGKDPRDVRVRIAGRFCRIAYQLVAGRQVFRHPYTRKRDYILNKLIIFSDEHEIVHSQLKINLVAAVDQIPLDAIEEETVALAEKLAQVRKQRGAGPRSLGEILPEVLARLGVQLIRSNESGEADHTERLS
jgi:hypothetical protein